MNLSHWEIHVQGDASPDGSLALIRPADQMHFAALHIGKAMKKCDPEQQREAIVHELLHLLLFRMVRVVDSAIDCEQPGKDMLMRVLHTEFELATQDTARILAPSLPLPS